MGKKAGVEEKLLQRVIIFSMMAIQALSFVSFGSSISSKGWSQVLYLSSRFLHFYLYAPRPLTLTTMRLFDLPSAKGSQPYFIPVLYPTHIRPPGAPARRLLLVLSYISSYSGLIYRVMGKKITISTSASTARTLVLPKYPLPCTPSGLAI